MKEGEVVHGTVLSVDEDHVQVDVGFKSEGLIPAWEFMDDDGTHARAASATSSTSWSRKPRTTDGRIVLSKEKADRLQDLGRDQHAPTRPTSRSRA